jgi:uncharacterized membrane protein
MNDGKDLGGSGCVLRLTIVWSVLVEQQKTSIRISDSPTEIRTEHLVQVWSVTAIPARSDTAAGNMLMLSKVLTPSGVQCLPSMWCLLPQEHK